MAGKNAQWFRDNYDLDAERKKVYVNISVGGLDTDWCDTTVGEYRELILTQLNTYKDDDMMIFNVCYSDVDIDIVRSEEMTETDQEVIARLRKILAKDKKLEDAKKLLEKSGYEVRTI